MTRRRLSVVLAGAALTLAFALFGPTQAAPPEELVVFAATSLREAFQSLAGTFERKHPGTRVRLNFAGSQELRVQIEQGAKADVFASADLKHMQSLQEQNLASISRIFARNQPVLIVPRANPAKLARFIDLPKAGRIVVGAPEVPIGAYAETILSRAQDRYGAKFRADVVAHIRSRELNVRQVLAKVALGEADAGIVYQTDILAAKDRVLAIEIPDAINVVASYPIAVLVHAPRPDLAKQWVDAVLGGDGQRALRAAGFLPAPDAAAGTGER